MDFYATPPGAPGPISPVVAPGTRWAPLSRLRKACRKRELVLGAASVLFLSGLLIMFETIDRLEGGAAPTGIFVGGAVALVGAGLAAVSSGAYFAFDLPRATIGCSVRIDRRGPFPQRWYLIRGPRDVAAWFDKALGVRTDQRFDAHAERRGRAVRRAAVGVQASQVAFVLVLFAAIGLGTSLGTVPLVWAGAVLSVVFLTPLLVSWAQVRLWAPWYRETLLERAAPDAAAGLAQSPSFVNVATGARLR